jgi:peptidyl-prolyl cis-trans isomerase SurA
MKKLLGYSIFILLIGLVLTQCAKQGENVVVTVGDLTITDAQVRSVLKAKYSNQDSFKDLDLNRKKELLEPLITKNLRINAAYDLDLEEDEKFIRMLEDQKMRTMGRKYYELMIIDKIIPEGEIEKIITRQGVELKASHILIGFKGSRRSADRTREEAEKLVGDILKELKAGAEFSITAQKYSDDPSAKKNKGELGYFTWGRMVGPFQEAAWELDAGEISGPVETMFGFHIIKLEDRREVPNYTPDRSDRNINRLKQMVMKSYGDSARVLWTKHYDGLKKKYNYVLYEDSIKYVSNLLKEKTKVEKIQPGGFTSEQREITLAEYEGEKVTLGTLIDRYKDQLVSAFRKFHQDKVLRSEIDRLSMNRQVMISIKENGIDKLPDVVREIRKFTEEQMNKMMEQREVKEKVNPTDKEIKSYFINNGDLFKKGAEIEIWEINTKDQKLAEEIARKAKQGVNFEELAKKYSDDKSLKNKGGYLGFKKISGRGLVSREAHKLGPGGKIGGPVKYRRGWSVFKTGSKREEGIMGFQEAKSRAKNLLIREQTLQVKAEWEKNLKDEYPVIIDEEKLKEI